MSTVRNKPTTPIKKKLSDGFTLIELLVSVTIFLLMTGVALVNYRNFNQRQSISQSARNIQESLRFAQKKARVGEKPSGCDSPAVLQGYAVRTISATGNSYQLYAVCSNGDFPVGEVITLVGGTRFNLSGNANIIYRVLAGGINAPTVLRLRNGSLCYEFAVNNGGEISQGNFINCP